MKINGKFKGVLKFEPVNFKEVIIKVVSRQNEFGGKISLPIELVGKELIILVPNDEK